MPRPLDEKEKVMLEYIRSRIADSVPPSIREMCKDLNIKSTSSVHRRLKSLESKGYITCGDYTNRSIKLVGVKTTDQVPLIGTVAAGNPILAFEDIEEYIPFAAEKDDVSKLFALKIKGDSMIEDHIVEGDIVIVKRTQTIENGEVAVAMVDNEATVKHFYKENGHFRLQPANKNMQPIIVDKCDVVGKVIYVMREVF